MQPTSLGGEIWIWMLRLHLLIPLLPRAPSHIQVVYCVRNEYAQTINDFIARRTRFAFTDANAAEMAIPRVADLMVCSDRALGFEDMRPSVLLSA